MELLDAAERDAGGGPPELERVIEAFIMPAFRAAHDPDRGGMVFRRLMGRLWAEGDLLPRIAFSHFVPLLERFVSALARSLPDMPQEELLWRVYLGMGAVAQALRGGRGWEVFRGPLPDSGESEVMLQRLIAFLSAALRAPVSSPVLQEK
jgi:hypothetical protein